LKIDVPILIQEIDIGVECGHLRNASNWVHLIGSTFEGAHLDTGGFLIIIGARGFDARSIHTFDWQLRISEGLLIIG
jgi:hypothetical protein